MKITRLALLIGAPGGRTSPFLNGVAVDLETFKEFLMSPQGGAWKEKEIITLYDPSLARINAVFPWMHAHYMITYFSGHGSADIYGNRFLQLSNGESFKDIELLNSSPRQLILVDACRNVTVGVGISGLREQYSNFTGDPDSRNARKLYDFWIKASKPGKVIIHSTQHNTSAYDTPSGGAFTQNLIFAGSNVPQEKKYNLMSIMNSGKYVPGFMKMDGFNQKPQLTYREGNPHLPFALSFR